MAEPGAGEAGVARLVHRGEELLDQATPFGADRLEVGVGRGEAGVLIGCVLVNLSLSGFGHGGS
jgi:hypothetical protein